MGHNAGSQNAHNNRLSYVGASYYSPHTAPNVNLSMPPNDIALAYGTLNNGTCINGLPNRNISEQNGTLGIETIRPKALVSSYISSLNNAAVSIKMIKKEIMVLVY